MGADRLVAALLFRQARRRVTAAELAEELEISERTARRDLEGLALAGIPVYSQAGRGGGWSLVGGATTDLSGLTGAEVRTLFLIAGPSAATPPVKAALRKLVRALPETFRAEAEAAASASARKAARTARTSFRSAAFTAGVAAEGPAMRKRVRTSTPVRPDKSVVAPPTKDQPPPRPAWE